MFENKTPEAIHEAMLAEVADDIDKREGSVAYDLSYPPAIELGNAYIALDTVLSLGFADTAKGEWLDRITIPFGIVRKPAIQAAGTITLTGPAGTEVPEGTRVQTSADVFFATGAAVVLVDGTATVDVIAEEGGTAGNVGVGEINALAPGNLYGIVTPYNAQPLTGGVDDESDAALLQRLKDRAANPATSGNANHYRQWALEVAGIGNAKVYPTASGPGTVKVVLLSAESKAPTPAQVAEAVSHINTEKPIGAAVTVVAAQETAINVTAQLTLAAGTAPAEAKAEFEKALADYLKTLAFADPIVRYAKIASILIDVTGVQDYANLKVNGGTANVTIADGAVAIAGAVTFA